MEKIKSTNLDDYEVLIRRSGETEYAAYCPQLNYILKGAVHEEVDEEMRKYINNYINNLATQE